MMARSMWMGSPIKLSPPKTATGKMAQGKHNGVRRPATRNIRDETYQTKGVYGTHIRAAAANAAIQRGG
jgi:hypothetical protein